MHSILTLDTRADNLIHPSIHPSLAHLVEASYRVKPITHKGNKRPDRETQKNERKKGNIVPKNTRIQHEVSKYVLKNRKKRSLRLGSRRVICGSFLSTRSAYIVVRIKSLVDVMSPPESRS